jgi:transcriptional regulator with XRE-family HTH domain
MPTANNTEDWPIILKRIRELRKLSLRQLETKTGISNSYLSQLENGQIKDPSFFKMIRLLSTLGISVKDYGDVWEIEA